LKIVGPCAVEFTRIKTSDHFWTDPHADELVQRHRMHSSNRTMTNTAAMMVNVNNSSPKFQPKYQANVRAEKIIENYFFSCDFS
jgi:hypothetical protein